MTNEKSNPALAAADTCGDGLDALLDSVHPRALIRTNANHGDYFFVVIEWPNEHGTYISGNATSGTGPTRMLAIADAVAKANSDRAGED